MLYPKPLQKGDTVGVIAPASPGDMARLHRAIPFLEQMGLRVKLGNHIHAVNGYLAGSDKQRLDDIHNMFEAEEIKAIFFARGGYGTGRLVRELDYSLIRENPKIMWGYSDITYLHTAIRQQTGLVTFHGPMLVSDIARDDFSSLSAMMFGQLFEPMEVLYTEAISPLDVINDGVATGELVGGNLSLIVSTLGTPYELDVEGKILVIEDIDELPYRIDSMLNQLKLAGKLEAVAGIVIGDFANAKPKKQPSLTLEEVFHHYFSPLNCPVMQGFKIGHCQPHFAIPLGVKATLDTKKKELQITPGVQNGT